MVYLDYSATTFVDEKVLEEFVNSSKFGANPNSTHKIGTYSSERINNSIRKIKELLLLDDEEVVITSGASESNNTVIKGIVEKYKIEKIITTRLEHSSIIAPISYIMKNGIEVVFCDLENGLVNLDNLLNEIDEKRTLVSICAVDSELGIKQPIDEIGKLLKNKENVIFHSDITQAIGKIKVDLKNIDLASFSAHKIYGFKGIGALIKKKEIELEPLIHGGKSITRYRSGTPQTELICSLSSSLDLIIPKIEENYNYVCELNKKLVDNLKDINIKINSINNIPHILNFSIIGKDSEDTKQFFSDNNIYISSKTACSSNTNISKSVLEITNDEERAKSSIRVSLSHKTTSEEIDIFIKSLERYINL